jgi:hypothetical protein
VAGPEDFLDLRVVPGTLIRVGYEKTDGGSGCFSLEHPREQGNPVILLAGRCTVSLTGFATIKGFLDDRLVKLDAGRASVNHTAKAGPVGLAKGGHPKDGSKAVSAHA